MAEIKCWVLGRTLYNLDEEGNVSGAVMSEISTEDWPVDTTDVMAFPSNGEPPLLSISLIGPLTPAQANTINGLARYVVLAGRYTQSEDNGELAGTDYPGWGPDDPITEERWTDIAAGLAWGGIPAGVITAWRTNNPEGTPTKLYRDLVAYLGANGNSESPV